MMPDRKPETTAPHLLSGQRTEDTAHQFLLNHGLKPIARNFRCRQGELDIIMRDGQTLVIVEVRYRKTARYGSAAETVTAAKQSRIITATQFYLSQLPQSYNPAIRFDVIALSGSGSIEWIKNAF